MPVLKCKMCGGNVSVLNDSTTGKCDYCGTVMTIPRVNDDRVTNLFNRANHYRMQGDFDRAITTYENILAEDNSNAEAHWCIVLCRFGVEYVDDPYTHKKVATCHRTNHASVFSDTDYQDAIRYADPIAKELYETEAQQINEIQKGILKVSQAEEPFDIFISYKESDVSGARTKDSVIAQDLYLRLTQEGYRVFFSRISLEDKIGRQYEPYIFSALNSAKVMLLIGTCQEHFNAPWVKNEWSRFLKLAQNDSNRILIPCYRDMDIYDLPEELSILQCQDMSKLGFEQDLLHGIQKILRSKQKNDDNTGVPTSTPDSLLKRAQMFLADCNWTSAGNYYNRVLDLNPECAEAYVGKMCAEFQAISYDMLGKGYFAMIQKEIVPYREKPLMSMLEDHVDYKRAIQFADSSLRQILEAENAYVKKRVVEALEENLRCLDNDLTLRKKEVIGTENHISFIKSKIEKQEENLLAKSNAKRPIQKRSDKTEGIFIAIGIIVWIIEILVAPPSGGFNWFLTVVGLLVYAGITLAIASVVNTSRTKRLAEIENEIREESFKLGQLKRNDLKDAEKQLHELMAELHMPEHMIALRKAEIASLRD